MDFTKIDWEEMERLPYRKKSKRKVPKKAKHQHQYESVLLKYKSDNPFIHGDFECCGGSRCTICGKLVLGFPRQIKDSWFFFFRSENPIDKHPDLPIIPVKDIWAKEIETI